MLQVEHELKIVVLGEASVGKTSILHRYVTGNEYTCPVSTINASFFKKKLTVNNIHLNIQLWDTAGQEKFNSITPMYYRNADIILIVFAVDCIHSFERAVNQVNEVRSKLNKPFIVLLGNKSDLINVVQNVAEEFARDSGYGIYYLSAANGDRVEEVFGKIIEEACKTNGNSDQRLVVESEKAKKKCC
ncbi:Rab1a [Hexamita inflata]|uniref:Rab1a n=1 Tax=Hexamita inflata TaxID=28002 RepID=A0AA86V3P6_9EUKA|nr:Rab1a [Hexamita inflata]